MTRTTLIRLVDVKEIVIEPSVWVGVGSQENMINVSIVTKYGVTDISCYSDKSIKIRKDL